MAVIEISITHDRVTLAHALSREEAEEVAEHLAGDCAREPVSSAFSCVATRICPLGVAKTSFGKAASRPSASAADAEQFILRDISTAEEGLRTWP
jgi:hypothetical protein